MDIPKDSYTTSTGNTGYRTNSPHLTILNLHGSYDEMGQQYGILAAYQLNKIYNDIAKLFFRQANINTAIAYFIKEFYRFKIDSREREILNGMAKTSGLTYGQLLELDVLPLLMDLDLVDLSTDTVKDPSVVLTRFLNAPTDHCSFVSVWGNRSQDHAMLVARNLDLIDNIISLTPYASLVVYQPNNGNNKVAAFGFLGSIPGFSWINDKGLFSGYNDGSRAIPGYNPQGFLNLNINFYAMLSVNSTTEFIDYLKSHPTLISNLTPIVDVNQSLCVENPVNINPPVVTNGQMKNANFFTNIYPTPFPEAKLTIKTCIDKVKDTPSFACYRYHVIENYLNNNPIINVENLKDLFTTPLDDDGIYQTGKSVNYPVKEITVYTLVGNLATGKYVYNNFNDKSFWTKIDIQQLFNS